mmetsp:Transcript_89661/g.239613  ORF Transcript_89661/g.239613 Transcript_89661/m.239613 type:complete len:125 (-) Transcript_89661:42-416(-)
MKLFHGTDRDSAMKIMHLGLDRVFTHVHAFGKGVYFARNASYSCNDRYSKPDDQKNKYIFIVRVLVGDFCVGCGSDKVPPKPRPGGDAFDICDSTVDNETSPSIFVTYRDSQTYPEYLLTFRSG